LRVTTVFPEFVGTVTHASRMVDSVVVPLWVSPQCSPLAEVRCSCGFSIGLIVDARSVSEQRSDWAERRERRM